MSSLIPQSYIELKQKTINIIRSKLLVSNILRGRGKRNQLNPNHGGFQAFQGRQLFQPNNSFQTRNQWTGNNPPHFNNRGGANPFNSTNVPRWMANILVPMDIDRVQAPPQQGQGGFRGFGRGAGANAAQINQGRNNRACFNCSQQGHFACNCPQK